MSSNAGAAGYHATANPGPPAAGQSATACGTRSPRRAQNPYAAARCLARADRPFDAAIVLLAAQKQGYVSLHWQDSRQLLASLYQRIGLPDQAAGLAPALAATAPASVCARFVLDQARAWLRRGEPDRAENRLRILRPGDGNVALQMRRQSLMALAQLQQGAYAAAVATLSDQQGFPKRNLADHYNYAVALVRAGRVQQGLALLDEIGTVATDDPVARGIRDRANLQLGWRWLRQKQGATARPIFQRIRLHGPYSDKALLGLGWAQLAPDGGPQTIGFTRRLFCPDMQTPHPNTDILLFYTRRSADCRKGQAYPFHMVHEFAYAPGVAGDGRLRNALRYWTELVRRDAAEPAVQEALLATGYAYRQARALEQAGRAYRRAASAYRHERQRRERLARALDTPGSDPLDVMHRPDFAGYLVSLRGSGRFALATQEYRAAQRMLERAERLRARIRALSDKLPGKTARLRQLGVRRQRLATDSVRLRGQLRAYLKKRLLDALDRQNRHLQTYRRATQLALTRLYE